MQCPSMNNQWFVSFVDSASLVSIAAITSLSITSIAAITSSLNIILLIILSQSWQKSDIPHSWNCQQYHHLCHCSEPRYKETNIPVSNCVSWYEHVYDLQTQINDWSQNLLIKLSEIQVSGQKLTPSSLWETQQQPLQ